jgi:hypothetical protein
MQLSQPIRSVVRWRDWQHPDKPFAGSLCKTRRSSEHATDIHLTSLRKLHFLVTYLGNSVIIPRLTAGHSFHMCSSWLGVSQSQSHIATDGRSVGRSVGQSVSLSVCLGVEPPDINHCLTVTVLPLGGRPLWREDGSVVCQSVTSIRSIASIHNFYILHVSHVIE